MRAGSRQALRILIVEDEAILAMDLERTIQECGHEVVGEVPNLSLFSAIPEQACPHLAFVDIRLADETSGLTVSAMIKQRWPTALIIFVTASPRLVPADYGAHGVLTKPFSHAGLTATLAYFSEGVFDPPPRVGRPECLSTSPEIMSQWMLGTARPPSTH